MRLHFEEQDDALTRITSYGNGYVEVNETRHTSSLVLLTDRLAPQWPVHNLADLTSDHVKALLAEQPEVVLIGTGAVSYTHLTLPTSG